jgi:hypothetical protein
MRLLTEFLRNPGEFVQHGRRQKVLPISLFSMFFVCTLLVMVRTAAGLRIPSEDLAVSSPEISIRATGTKWWVRETRSPLPGGSLKLLTQTATPAFTAFSEKCPPYAADFKPGTYGYISALPPIENLVRSGAGASYSSIGYIEAGDWVRILDFPICADEGYVWLKVQSAHISDGWTAGGRRNAQWVIPCSEPDSKCTRKKEVQLLTSSPGPVLNKDQVNRCMSNRLIVGQNAQVSPDDLLVIRQEPYSGEILGRISPAAVVTIIEGPECEAGVTWWKVISKQLSGWAVENLLKPCPEQGACTPWQ